MATTASLPSVLATRRQVFGAPLCIDNLTPADVCFGGAEAILAERKRIKRDTIANRRLQDQLQAA
ncbi:hypothetical protein [Bradyrhizobium arachidis]|uniref:hypothetical protein n=1 Tax=Bradyrhizobium arachidis TaxID=858423 RepID=UPI0021621972|nr:hypothetical protein [Bradyrhizobium arachidis]UVO30226.1 hypothetical protein KUF59_05550 [Bradyrhizobium arachidis]